MRWLARQCFKEFWGTGVSKYDRRGVFVGMMKNLIAEVAEIDVTIDRYEILDVLEGLKAEFSHYCSFADTYDAIRPAGTPRLNPEMLESWPEEDALTALRYRHQDEHGALGMRACKFTEGGYCTLFSEGMALEGRGGIDDKIAEACAMVYDDEFGHMLAGIAGIQAEGLSDADWQLLEHLVAEQMQAAHPHAQRAIRLSAVAGADRGDLPRRDQAAGLRFQARRIGRLTRLRAARAKSGMSAQRV